MSKHASNQAEAPVPAVKEPTALAVAPPQPTQEILSSDIVIPKLLLMQGQSEFVQENKAQLGRIVRSTTVQVLVEPGASLDFIPLKVTTGWAEKEKVGQKFEFRRSFPRTNSNDHLPWQFWRNAQSQDFDKPGMMGATEWCRVKSIDVYALLPQDVDAFTAEMAKAQESGEIPDLSKTVLPVVISFRSTSFNAGKAVTTFFAQVAEMALSVEGLRASQYVLPLSAKPEKNDKGAYFIFEVGQAKKLDPKYAKQAQKWLETLTRVKDIKVDDSGESERAESSQY